jgi:hypothetical protein
MALPNFQVMTFDTKDDLATFVLTAPPGSGAGTLNLIVQIVQNAAGKWVLFFQ